MPSGVTLSQPCLNCSSVLEDGSACLSGMAPLFLLPGGGNQRGRRPEAVEAPPCCVVFMSETMQWQQPDLSNLQVVNGPSHPGAVGAPPSRITPALPVIPGMDVQQKTGWRDLLTQQGPEAWAKAVREHKGLLLTDTTM